MWIEESEFGQAADNRLALNGDVVTVCLERNGTKLIELDTAVVLSNDTRIGSCVGCHATGVGCTERKLSSRLTDGLRGNDTDSLTLLNHAAGSKVASVTLHADTFLALASEHRTNLDTLDGAILYYLGYRLCYLFSG